MIEASTKPLRVRSGRDQPGPLDDRPDGEASTKPLRVRSGRVERLRGRDRTPELQRSRCVFAAEGSAASPRRVLACTLQRSRCVFAAEGGLCPFSTIDSSLLQRSRCVFAAEGRGCRHAVDAQRLRFNEAAACSQRKVGEPARFAAPTGRLQRSRCVFAAEGSAAADAAVTAANFNEAAACSQRKGRRDQSQDAHRLCFNEAAACSQRKGSVSTLWGWLIHALQRSRCVFAAEGPPPA